MGPPLEGGYWVGLYERDHFASPERFSASDSKTMRIVAIVSSSVSIFAGLIGLYMYGAIHPRKRVFRHQLILFLILFDFIKAIILLIYPATVMSRPEIYDNEQFCSTVGFFSAFAIEGADLAILTFAIHIFILIFWPSFKVANGTNIEGGLFKARYYVYVVSVVLPALLAALAFINREDPYFPQTTWCYLPSSPVAYQLALSWVPRWCIMVLIFAIYISVYWHVVHEYSRVSGSMNDMTQRDIAKQMLRESFLYKAGKILLMLLFPDIQISAKLYGRGLDTDLDKQNLDRLRNMGVDDIENNLEDITRNVARSPLGSPLGTSLRSPLHSPLQSPSGEENPQDTSAPAIAGLDIQRSLHRETMEMFQIRKLQIMKQMKAVFIYPLAYLLLWLFPFINEGVRLHYGGVKDVMPWLAGMSAFFQAFNCTVDTFVFLLRETPWKLTVSRIDRDGTGHYAPWRYWVSWLPLYKMNEPSQKGKLNRPATVSNFSDASGNVFQLNLMDDAQEIPDFIKPFSNFKFEGDGSAVPMSASAIVSTGANRQLSVVDPMQCGEARTGTGTQDAEGDEFSLADVLRMGPPSTPPPESSGMTANDDSQSPNQQRRRSSKFSWLGISLKGSFSGSSRKHSAHSAQWAGDVSPVNSGGSTISPTGSWLAHLSQQQHNRLTADSKLSNIQEGKTARSESKAEEDDDDEMDITDFLRRGPV
ncbi:unnamed protein product [Kuraishia capsulata CBS 1993]|uniref:G-protein coupled receptors family 1 profile domain-containing protein n=1 Tax=Kuraishia capsulata CBS 1993 TaxID=1382522 RepID=W6MXJ1_9ASCO|nr:uncharacterized protein KUCA_T00004966001 [Kuraishia capsulata CBS 1993]CDK28980.1 unnamed protein product [Kuraishia capsulata CBS 1993]